MGKAQSKRSVDITTEVKDANVENADGTGKVGKIEDVDQLKPQLNGDTNHKDAETDQEKKVEKDQTENEKGSATEKDPVEEKPEPVVNGEGDAPAVAVEEKSEENKSEPAPVENGTEELNESTDVTLNESKISEAGETTTEGEAAATPSGEEKKKKKKRWSFRSFSFSKKDKQKPTKKSADEAAAGAVTNGECEKVPEETGEEATPATEKSVDSPTEEKKSEEASATNGSEAAAAPAVEEPKAAEPVAQAPIATPEAPAEPVVAEKVEAPAAPEPVKEEQKLAAEESKPEAEQTVEEAIADVAKNVEIEKVNDVAKPEENGHAESPVKQNGSEKLNGDHKTIEEIVPSPEKLEKLAAVNTSTEVATAE